MKRNQLLFLCGAVDPFCGILESRPRQLNLLTTNPSLAANFSPQDAGNLLSVMLNSSLAAELRRSAAEQLLSLTMVPQLLAPMVQQAQLEAIWRLCLPGW